MIFSSGVSINGLSVHFFFKKKFGQCWILFRASFLNGVESKIVQFECGLLLPQLQLQGICECYLWSRARRGNDVKFCLFEGRSLSRCNQLALMCEG